MSPNSKSVQGRRHFDRGALNPVAEHLDDFSVFHSPVPATGAFPATARVDAGGVEGTVGTSLSAVDEQSYGEGSRVLLNDAPLGSPGRPQPVPPGLRAALLVELREISGQVNRMMSQVDRAIHRMGEHAGEPLRR